MKALNAIVSDSADLTTTGLRQTALCNEEPGSVARGAAPSTPDDYSLEAWGVDEAPETEPPVPAGELLAERYTVEGIFAEGGMGVVCLGRHAQLDQPVAIKFLRRALSGKLSIVQRFLNEARALAALRSEHVVRVMDVGQLESGRPYLVMEHLDGIDLDALVARNGPLSVDTAVSYALQICEPLAEAHALGIVHRDIKPANLFLWSGGPAKDIVKVLDFGLSKQLGTHKALAVTGPQDSIGSPCYMSPEQIVTPHQVDSRTDIWSLGVVLYWMLTATLPFDGSGLVEILSHVLNAAPRSLLESAPGLDSELEAIVLRCLEKKPEARYGSMSELEAALSAYLEQRRERLPSVRPPSAPEPSPSSAPVFADDDAKIVIAGVHARWPAVLFVSLALLSGAAYQADHSGRIRLRDATDGWLTPGRLAVGAQSWSARVQLGLPFNLARGVLASEPTREANGTPALRALPEIERAESAADETAASPLMSDEERAQRQADYRDYLKSQGLTPLSEALPAADEAVSP